MSKMAASPHLCLRWNNYQSNLTSVFDQLLQNETFVDVTLAADGHAIKAHRMVLSACSPYFQALFFDNPCQHPIVILKDTRWSELKAIVEYMYRGEISVAQEELASLLRVAETLKIRGLSELNSSSSSSSDRGGAGVCADGEPLAPVTPSLVQASSAAAASSSSRRIESPTSSWPIVHQQWSQHGDDEDTPTASPSPPARMSSAAKRRRVSAADGNASTTPVSPDGSTPGPLTVVHHHHHHDDASMDAAGADFTGAASPAPSTPASTPLAPAAPVTHHAEELDIKPGIAELIREEERARMLEGSHPWLTASPSVLTESLVQWRSKAPSWSKEQLQEAIQAIVTQRMRFTQASAHYGIPKGTLYDNILGKSKRMLVLDEVALEAHDEEAVLDFCCETSVMPYNRRTNKSLESITAFVEKLKSANGSGGGGGGRRSSSTFKLAGLIGFRWWWAFCKKHNIVSLFYAKNSNNNNNSTTANNNSEQRLSSNNNNLSPTPSSDGDLPENLSKQQLQLQQQQQQEEQARNAAAPFYRSINNNNIHLNALRLSQLGQALLISQTAQQQQQLGLRSRTHSVDQDEDSDLEPENLSVHKD